MTRDATVVFDLELGKVREFAKAVHIDDSALLSSDGRMCIPPTFLTTMNFLEGAEEMAEELGFDLARMLHGEQEYSFVGGPPAAGTRLWASSRVIERYEKESRRGRLRFAVRETIFVDEGGSAVATARMTAVETPVADPAVES